MSVLQWARPAVQLDIENILAVNGYGGWDNSKHIKSSEAKSLLSCPMPPKERAKDARRSKSADHKWSVVNNRLTNAVSRSLPTMNRLQKKPPSVPKPPKEKKRKKRKNIHDETEKDNAATQLPPPPKVIVTDDKRNKTLWKHIVWLIVLFAYSLFGGLVFSAIEGGHERALLSASYEKSMNTFRSRREYQQQLFNRLKSIDHEKKLNRNDEHYKLLLMRDALEWYERKMGFEMRQPTMTDTKWTLWGGVYYAASLYTTIGYGNFHPNTASGRIVSMLYAFIGIPLVFTILLEWGFLYFTWIEYGWNYLNERFCQKTLQRRALRLRQRERVRRVGSELSLRSTSTTPLLSVHRCASNQVNTVDHQMESNRPLVELDIIVPEKELVQTVPMKAALIFFLLWITLAAFIVRIWEYEWSYFSAFYFFFTSLTTIGLGDVVTKTPNFIIFNLALTLVGLSVVGLCVAIVQAKVRLVFDRMIRSIDSQYRIRQIDPEVATMTVVPDENEGIKRLIEAQPLQDRVIFLFMDEHKKSMLRERWRIRSNTVNRITQTYPSRADKYVQTGNRVYDQPVNSDGEYESYSDEDEDESQESESESRIFVPNARRYIYTVFD